MRSDGISYFLQAGLPNLVFHSGNEWLSQGIVPWKIYGILGKSFTISFLKLDETVAECICNWIAA